MIRETEIIFSDRQKSAAFYRRVLGQEPRLEVPGMTEFELGPQAVLGLMPEAGILNQLGTALPDPGAALGVPRVEPYLQARLNPDHEF